MTDLLDDALAAQLGRPLYDAINKHLADGQRAEAEAARLRLMVDEYGTGASALSDKLGEARETNRRLNHEKQRLESELTAYRRAISTWEFTERGTYVPLRSITAMAKAAGVGYDGTRYELHYERVERVEAQLTAVADLIADHEGDEWAAHPATTALRCILDSGEHAIAQPGRWLHIAFTSPDETTANTSALNLADHLRAEFDGVSMRISSNAVEAELDPFSYEERERTGRNAGLHGWILEGGRDLSIPEHRRFTAHPVTPEMERAATERARQAAADSERSAAWFAKTGGVLGAPSCSPAAPETEPNNPRTTVDNPDGAELERLRAKVAEFDHIINWHTTCASCARILDSAIRETERAEKAEGALREVLAAADAPTHCHEHPTTWDGGGPCTYCTALAAARTVLDEPRPEPGTHVYLSTGCHHGDHAYCQAMTGLNGAKRPASCKKCGARCICPCHQQTEPPVHVGGGANAEDCPACTGTNPDYPFICPGPDAEQPARTTANNPPTSEDVADNPAATEATDLRARVTALYEQWVKAGPPPLGVSTARWWDRRLVELRDAIRPAAEQPVRTTAKNPAATEATDTWKEPTHPHPCTATIEGRATPGGRQVQCTREARHPENHVGPKLGSDGRVLWTDRNEGAVPHKEQP